MKLEILRAGPLTSVQDLGRFGLREFGVAVGGALDAHAARVANLLVGNAETTALLELTLGGIRLRLSDARAIAWCGGAFNVTVGGVSVPAGRYALVRPEEELKIGHAERGCRAWLAIAGGVDVPSVLGSRSTDLRAKFGGFHGRRLRDGDSLSLGPALTTESERVANWGAPTEWTNTAARVVVLRVVRGADWSRFGEDDLTTFVREWFAITANSDRMGARLSGPMLNRIDSEELASETVMPGTVQVPPAGQPILLLGDCQTIGGYPKIAHVITVDLPVAAQLRTGDQVRFQEIEMAEAHRLLLRREQDLQRFRIGVHLRAGG